LKNEIDKLKEDKKLCKIKKLKVKQQKKKKICDERALGSSMFESLLIGIKLVSSTRPTAK
jgi:hypothetical protein